VPVQIRDKWRAKCPQGQLPLIVWSSWFNSFPISIHEYTASFMAATGRGEKRIVLVPSKNEPLRHIEKNIDFGTCLGLRKRRNGDVA
jgi:hypothetical protein